MGRAWVGVVKHEGATANGCPRVSPLGDEQGRSLAQGSRAGAPTLRMNLRGEARNKTTQEEGQRKINDSIGEVLKLRQVLCYCASLC